MRQAQFINSCQHIKVNNMDCSENTLISELIEKYLSFKDMELIDHLFEKISSGSLAIEPDGIELSGQNPEDGMLNPDYDSNSLKPPSPSCSIPIDWDVYEYDCHEVVVSSDVVADIASNAEHSVNGFSDIELPYSRTDMTCQYSNIPTINNQLFTPPITTDCANMSYQCNGVNDLFNFGCCMSESSNIEIEYTENMPSLHDETTTSIFFSIKDITEFESLKSSPNSMETLKSGERKGKNLTRQFELMLAEKKNQSKKIKSAPRKGKIGASLKTKKTEKKKASNRSLGHIPEDLVLDGAYNTRRYAGFLKEILPEPKPKF